MARADYATARAYFERAARLTPDYPTLEINLGIVEGALGSNAIAEGHFQRALALLPDATSHFYYARWLASTRRAPDALVHLRQSIALSPGGLDARHLLMRLLAAEDANADLRQAAADKGANAVVAMRFDSGDIGGVMNEVAAYGTAVRVTKL